MASGLSRIPADRRRRMAAMLGLMAALFVAVGAVAESGNPPAAVRVFGGVAFVVAAANALLAWGVAHSVRVDADARQLDDAISEVLAGHDVACGCGHDHDPSEVHVTGEATCRHDGQGADCEHDCQTCVLANLRR